MKGFFWIVFASWVHLATRKHRWIFHGLVYYDATNVNLTENPLTSTVFEQTDSLLSQWHLPRFQNALQCTISHLTDVPGFHEEKFYFAARKTEWDNVAYASMHRLVWFNHRRLRSRRCQILRITFFPCFHFRFVFLFFHEGPKWVVRWTTTASASKMSKSSDNHGGWQRKWVPTFLLQKSQTRKAAPKYYRCQSRNVPLKGFTFISSLNLCRIVNQIISSVFWN